MSAAFSLSNVTVNVTDPSNMRAESTSLPRSAYSAKVSSKLDLHDFVRKRTYPVTQNASPKEEEKKGCKT